MIKIKKFYEVSLNLDEIRYENTIITIHLPEFMFSSIVQQQGFDIELISTDET